MTTRHPGDREQRRPAWELCQSGLELFTWGTEMISGILGHQTTSLGGSALTPPEAGPPSPVQPASQAQHSWANLAKMGHHVNPLSRLSLSEGSTCSLCLPENTAWDWSAAGSGGTASGQMSHFPIAACADFRRTFLTFFFSMFICLNEP